MTQVTREVFEFIEKQRRDYLLNWGEGNAHKFEIDGHYNWMASFVSGFTRVFEIGTGDGRGTLNLVKSGHKVIGIDENSACLDAAETRLKNAGVKLIRIRREKISIAAGGENYSVDYAPIEISDYEDYDAILIDGDIVNDENLINWICNIEKFDAVVCWLIGTHSARIFSTAIDRILTSTSMKYRILVQNIVYAISEKILRNNGILHIVDRGYQLNTDLLREDFLNFHRDQASVTDLVVSSMDTRQYEDPAGDRNVGMIVSATEHTTPADLSQKYLHSVVSIKPCLP